MSRVSSTLFRASSLSLAIACAIPSLAYAATTTLSESAATTETAKKKAAHSSETMTVIATGNPRSSFDAPMMVTVIEGDSPLSQTASTSADMLRRVPGILISGTGRTNGQDVSLRGYNRNGVLTLVDGIRQGTDTGHINSTFLDPMLVKQIEIVRGPAAMLYGSGALGGVISYQTVDAADLLEPGHNTGYRVFGLGATGDHSLGMGASAFGKTDDLDGLISFGTRDVGNIRQSNGFNAPNDEAISNVLAKGTWTIDDNQSLSTNLRYYNNRAREPKNPQTPAASAGNLMTNRSTIQRDAQLSYTLHPQGQDWLDATATAYYSDVNIDTTTPGTGFEGREQKTHGAKLENRTRLFTDSAASHLLTYGTEAYRQEQTPGGATTSFPQAKINFASGWAQDEITLRDLPVTLLAGTRFDSYSASSQGNADVDADKWSSRGAVTVNPTDWLMVFGSYAQAFRAPTMGEIYNDSKHFSMGRFNNYWKPNPNLRPESNATQEFGFGLNFDGVLAGNDSLKFKASYFDTQAKDKIDMRVDTFTTTSININRAKIWGWDATMDYQTDWFSWNLAYNRTRGKNMDTGEFLDSSNPDTVTSALDIPIASTGFSAGWVATMVERNNIVTRSTKQQAGYGVNDFYISYKGRDQFKGVTTTAVLGNAFDKEYYSPQGIPQDGRNAKLFVSYQW
ncbi:hemin receptor [Yersinia nurmii]|uniref:Hemin receptor n=1 Tax=Yersinia nurmii TaxID=685706 RepID=A0ABM9SKH3_9GAMM|nr:TonB-dependent hemoglobin/transferrin/lactoferrin family receptor [Yersinia nurmii]CNE89829.1 hemin receptor [Yersinia nurmii]